MWLNACALAVCVCAVVGVFGLIAAKGAAHFWPAEVLEVRLSSDRTLIGERVSVENLSYARYLEAGGSPMSSLAARGYVTRWLLKTGNRRRNPPDFVWIYVHDIKQISQPDDVVTIRRTEWGNAYGRIVALRNRADGSEVRDAVELRQLLTGSLERMHATREAIHELRRGTINRIGVELETLRLRQRQLDAIAADADTVERLAARERMLVRTYREQEAILDNLLNSLSATQLRLRSAEGDVYDLDMATVLEVIFPNDLSLRERTGWFLHDVWHFVTEDPREANTEGGVFPAIFGTVMMVLIMAVVVAPVGVITAIYLHEYARQGPLVRLLRIAISNLAGVPSIVYGVFGLGFFVYFLGGNIDRLFFPEQLPAPTFGTPGIFWAALTLALLTVPVVIVSTEEGLARIPRSLREGSLALGATRAETLLQVVLPMATPAVLTGIILAVARAAGEVAPLMLVGVVKLAPALPIDGTFPYLHLDRKFMHLGFHIYDVGFQSANVEAARPLVYATALLLITIVVALNLAAIKLRSRLERRYQGIE